MRRCIIDECSTKTRTDSCIWCNKHYRRWKKYGDPNRKLKPLKDRFEEKYIPVTESGCWLWIATTLPFGYGQINVNNKMVSAHRVSWRLHIGPIPKGMCVLHKCDVSGCVNPDHLFLGTQAENLADMRKKGRDAKGEDKPASKLTEIEVLEIRDDSRTPKEISKNYNVDRSLIYQIKKRQIWKHI